MVLTVVDKAKDPSSDTSQSVVTWVTTKGNDRWLVSRTDSDFSLFFRQVIRLRKYLLWPISRRLLEPQRSTATVGAWSSDGKRSQLLNCVLCKSERHLLYACTHFKATSHDGMITVIKGTFVWIAHCPSLRSRTILSFTSIPRKASKESSCQTHLPSNLLSPTPQLDFMPDTPLMTCQILVDSPYGVLQSRFVLNVWLKLCNCLNLSRKSGIAHHSPLHSIVKFRHISNISPSEKIELTAVAILHVTSELPLKPVPSCIWDKIWLGSCLEDQHPISHTAVSLPIMSSVASSDDFLHKFWEVEENYRATPTFRKSEWWWRTLRKATVVLILAHSCHENLKRRASASLGLKPSADSSHLNALFDLGINLRNSLMWLKGTLRCDMQSMFPLLTYRTLDQVFYLSSMLCARSIEPQLEASANLSLVYLSMTPCLLDQLSIPPSLMCWFVFVFIALPSLLTSAKCNEPSNWFLQTEISIDLFGERISMSHWRVTARQGSPLECQLPHLLQTYQWSGDFFPCCPLAAQAVEKSFYVDCLTGADSSRCHWIARTTPGAIPQRLFSPPQVEYE